MIILDNLDTVTKIIIIGATLLLTVLLFLLVRFLVKKRLSKTVSFVREVAQQFDILYRPFLLLVPAICLLITLPMFNLPENIVQWVRQILVILIIAGVGWLALRLVSFVRVLIMSRYDLTVKDNLKARQVSTQLGVLQQVLNVLIIIIVIAAALMTFDKVRQIGVGLLASAGIAGIILGFAAQRSLATLIAGIQIAITQPIRIDDVVIIEGEWGRIEEITLTYAVVSIWDQRRLVVPLSYFLDHPFQNWTRTTAELLGPVYLYTDYRVPIEELRKELKKIVEASPIWDKRVANVQVTNMSDRTVEIRALVSAANSGNTWDLRCQVREKLLNFLQSNYPESLPRVRLEKN